VGLGSLVLREEIRLKFFENWVLRKVFGPKGEKTTGNCVMRSFMKEIVL